MLKQASDPTPRASDSVVLEWEDKELVEIFAFMLLLGISSANVFTLIVLNTNVHYQLV